MSLSLALSGKLDCLYKAVLFFKKHCLVILSLGLVAAFGRVIQLGGFGEITSATNIFLEVVIESARIILFLYVLGLANIKEGYKRIQHFFTHKQNRKLQWATAIENIKRKWVVILLNFTGFMLIAWVLNYLIDLLAYQTCLYLTLKKEGILSGSSSEWTILLFFKNLSVIPFTLVFEALFTLWITNKLTDYRTFSLSK